MMDSERSVVRNEQELAATAEIGLVGDFRQKFPFQHEQEGIPGKGGARDFRSPHRSHGFQLLDELSGYVPEARI